MKPTNIGLAQRLTTKCLAKGGNTMVVFKGKGKYGGAFSEYGLRAVRY